MQYLLAVVGVCSLSIGVAGCGAPESPPASAGSATDARAPEPETVATAPAPRSTESALAGRPRLVAPARGLAEVGYTKPVVTSARMEGRNFIVTKMRVQNMADRPIAGFKVDEFWYDTAGNPVTGASFQSPKPIPPGEVIEVTLETPRNPQMDSNTYKFSHQNGEIKTTLVPEL